MCKQTATGKKTYPSMHTNYLDSFGHDIPVCMQLDAQRHEHGCQRKDAVEGQELLEARLSPWETQCLHWGPARVRHAD
jgi:hypothetical protein